MAKETEAKTASDGFIAWFLRFNGHAHLGAVKAAPDDFCVARQCYELGDLFRRHPLGEFTTVIAREWEF